MSAEPVSVVMPVRNCAPFLDAAIQSILQQSHREFEFVIYDDASSDGSSEIIERWAAADARIRPFRGETPLGLAGSSDAATRLASGSIVARMDGDDISHPRRLSEQLQVLDAHPEVVAVGSLCDGIDDKGRIIRPRDSARALRVTPYPPFANGSSMFRKEAFEAIGGYRDICDGWEDVDLFLRLLARGDIEVILESLYSYRFHSTNATLIFDWNERLETTARAQACYEAHAHHGEYEEVLHRPITRTEAESFALLLYAQRGALSVWAGIRPPRPRLGRRRPAPGWWSASLRAMLYLTWGSVSPKTLRYVQAVMVRARDRVSMRRLQGQEHVRWRARA
jgi:glycosyltransferase involved in cell wall biosynthesis